MPRDGRRPGGHSRALLEAELPGTAQLNNNLFDASGGNVGGTGVVFAPRPSETGTDAYEAAVRIRDGERSANLHVTVERYHAVPADPQCRSEEMVADATSKGIVIVRCDRAERDDGTVVLTKADDYPYDLERSLLLPAALDRCLPPGRRHGAREPRRADRVGEAGRRSRRARRCRRC